MADHCFKHDEYTEECVLCNATYFDTSLLDIPDERIMCMPVGPVIEELVYREVLGRDTKKLRSWKPISTSFDECESQLINALADRNIKIRIVMGSGPYGQRRYTAKAEVRGAGSGPRNTPVLTDSRLPILVCRTSLLAAKMLLRHRETVGRA